MIYECLEGIVDNLYLIRHGESEFNADRKAAKSAGKYNTYSRPIKAGQDSIVPLTAKGMKQSEFTGKNLPEGIDIFITSPYLRARETCAIIRKNYAPRFEGSLEKPAIENLLAEHVDERVREKEYGIWNFYNADEMKQVRPDEVIRKKNEGRYWYRPTGGESIPDVRLRAWSFLDYINKSYSGLNVAIISHALTILSIRSILEDWSADTFIARDANNDVANCSVISYRAYLHSRFSLAEDSKIYYKEDAWTSYKNQE